MNKLALLVGPALFLLAELILPGGSADPATRLAIIRAHSAAWELGHQMISTAFAFLIVWLVDISSVARHGSRLLAGIGVWFTGFACWRILVSVSSSWLHWIWSGRAQNCRRPERRQRKSCILLLFVAFMDEQSGYRSTALVHASSHCSRFWSIWSGGTVMGWSGVCENCLSTSGSAAPSSTG